MDLAPREFDPEKVYVFVNPYRELNLGLWLLFSSASIFLFLRVWVKINYRHGLWYDDWILIISWVSTCLHGGTMSIGKRTNDPTDRQ
jgi:hypothetical protein